MINEAELTLFSRLSSCSGVALSKQCLLLGNPQAAFVSESGCSELLALGSLACCDMKRLFVHRLRQDDAL